MYLLVLYLLSIVPSLLAYPSGAPARACSDLMPQHGAEPQEGADGIYVLRGDVFDSPYVPGRTYQSKNNIKWTSTCCCSGLPGSMKRA